MANLEHLEILKRGVKVWNEWRKENKDIGPNLNKAPLNEAPLKEADLHEAQLIEASFIKADLSKANLCGAILRRANLGSANLHEAGLVNAFLREADLSRAYLNNADLRNANLIGANLSGADLRKANLKNADLSGASLSGAMLENANLSGAKLHNVNLSLSNLSGADLSSADLSDANLTSTVFTNAKLIGTNLCRANLNSAILSDADLTSADLGCTTFFGTTMQNTILNKCKVYGVSIWDLHGEIKEQKDLIITMTGEPEVTVDNIKVAQFIYLLLKNEEIRNVIDTITSKSVLILGRFTKERKKVLYFLKRRLRESNYLPILFDFTRPSDKNMIQTIKTLARLSKYVIVDLTDSRDARREVEAIASINHLPIRPIVLDTFAKTEYSWFSDYLDRETVIWPHKYKSEEELKASFTEIILTPAEGKYEELKQKRLEIELRLSKEKTDK